MPDDILNESRVTVVLAFVVSSGIVSVLGSTTIIVVLLRSEKRLKSTYRRVVFGMSCMDILHSLSYVVAGLPAPKDTTSWVSRNTIGNVTTCNIQGLTYYTGLIGSLFYDCMLSIYFVMVIVYSKPEDYIRTRIEPLFHLVSVVIPLGAGIFLVATNHINNGGIFCTIAEYPLDCGNPDTKVECTRGENPVVYITFFVGYPVIFFITITVLNMMVLSYSVRKQLKKMKKYGSNEYTAKVDKKRRDSIGSMPSPVSNLMLRHKRKNGSTKSETEAKQIFTQAMLYVTGLLLTFGGAFIYNVFGHQFWSYLLQWTFLPLLGFFNFFIFIRPRIVMIRQSKPSLNFVQVFITAITSKEVKAPSGRRGSMSMMTKRRGSQTYRRGSLTSTDTMVARAQLVVEQEAEEFKEEEHSIQKGIEDKYRLEREVEEMDSNIAPNSTYELDEMSSDPLPSCLEAQDNQGTLHAIGGPLDTMRGSEATACQMTDDYRNML